MFGYISRLSFVMDDVEITLFVLVLFVVLSFLCFCLKIQFLCDFFGEEKSLGEFYLLKEFICKETQIG